MGWHGAGHATQIAGPGLAHRPEPSEESQKSEGKGQNAKGKSNDRPMFEVCGFSGRRPQRAADLKTRSGLRAFEDQSILRNGERWERPAAIHRDGKAVRLSLTVLSGSRKNAIRHTQSMNS
jgi:hypothetical protein